MLFRSICNRSFANGKAMGGHMRSHFAKLPVPPKLTFASSSSTSPPPPTPSALSCPSSEVNHMQPYRSVNHELCSETESSRNPSGRRSKRLRNFALNMVGSPSDSVSSVFFPDETISSKDAAMCLLMLSRDKWSPKQEQKEIIYDGRGVGGEVVDVDLFCITNADGKVYSKYKCETCNKVFKSHQALGGHRASHKNKQSRASIFEEGEEDEEKEKGTGDYQIHRIFECPFCDKVFQSGQALGGHKRIHFSYLSVAHKKILKKSKSTVQLFDLNLPTSEELEEESWIQLHPME